MAEHDTVEVKQQGKGGVTVLPVNGRKFVVGLRWQALKSSVHYMREARQFGKDHGMDIVVIREGLVTQGGFVSKKSGVTKDMYSAASVLTDALGQSWLAVFRLDDDLYYLAAADKSAVIPDSDIIGSEDRIRARMMELNSMFEFTDDQIIAPEAWSFGGVEKPLESLLTPQNVKKKHKLKQLTFGLSKKEWFRYSTAAIVLGAVGIGAWTYFQFERRAELARQAQIEAARRAELARLDEDQRKQIASSSLTRPWTLKPRPTQMLTLCEEAIYSLPITIGGWVFQKSQCTPSKLDATYKRTTGATNVDFLREFARVFPGEEVPSDIKDDTEANFSIGMNMSAGGDDLDRLQANIRNIFVAHFQRVDHTVKVGQVASQVITPAFLPNGTPWPKNIPAPTPTWNTYAFVFDSADVPSNAMGGLPDDGIRVAIVEATFKEGDTSFSWKTVGEIYGLQ